MSKIKKKEEGTSFAFTKTRRTRGWGGRQVKREVKEREVMMVEKERCEKSRTDAALTSMY
jgi:hypothetical protein